MMTGCKVKIHRSSGSVCVDLLLLTCLVDEGKV